MREGLKSVRVDDNPPFVPSPVSCSGLNCGLAVVTATTEACLTSKPICITGDATESSGSEDSSDGNSPLPTDSPTSSEGFFAEYPPPKSPRRRSRRPHRPPLTHNASTDSGVSEPPLKPHLPTCTAVVHNTLNHRLRRQQIHYLSSDSQPQSDQSPLLPRSPPASPPLNHKEAALLHGYPLNARQITYSGPPVLPYPIGVSFVQTVYGILPAPIGFFPHNSLRHSAPSSEYRSQTSSKALIPPPFLPPPAGVMLDLTGMDVSVSVERLPPVHPRPLSFPPRHPFPPAYKAQLEQQQQQSPPPPYRGHHPAWPATSPATTYRRSLFSSSPASSVSSDEALASSESDEDLHHSNSDSLSSLTEDSPSARQSYLALRYRQLAVRGSQPVGWKPTHYPLQHNIHCLHHHHHQQYNQEQYAPFHVGAPHPALIHIPTPLRLPRAQDHCKSLRTCLVPYSEFRNYFNSTPPQRQWRRLEDPSKDGFAFTLMCYNVLSPNYATSSQYPYCPTWAMDWDYRRRGILEELKLYSPHIICLQEIDTDQFEDVFRLELGKAGYEGIFIPKSRYRTMDPSASRKVDGCAIFWLTDKFELIAHFNHEFMLSCSSVSEHPSALLLNRVMTRDNVALSAVFKTKGPGNVAGRRFCVSTGHIHWDPEQSDVKLIQSIMWTAELWAHLEQLSAASPLEKNSGVGAMESGAASKIPVIFCGDFNSLPTSGVVEFLSKGCVPKSHVEFLNFGFNYQFEDWKMLEKWAVDGDILRHKFDFSRAYAEGDGLRLTNFTYDFKGMIDYIFYTRQHFRLLGSLDQIADSWFADEKILGCPHIHVPSDHFSLLVEFDLLAAPRGLIVSEAVGTASSDTTTLTTATAAINNPISKSAKRLATTGLSRAASSDSRNESTAKAPILNGGSGGVGGGTSNGTASGRQKKR